MTDRASDQQVDIEQALAEHFRAWSIAGPFDGDPKCGTDGEPWPCSFWQAIARQAAIGAAVERLMKHANTEFWSGNPVLGDWPFYVRIGERPAFGGDTIEAAIAAALEDDR